MAVTVSKEFRWEMGHRLPYHETCKNIHGHSYRMVVEITGELDGGGMVIDFGDIATLVKPVVDQMDHSFMVDPHDALMRRVLAEADLKSTEVPFFSTAENIAQWVLEIVAPQLFQRESVSAVTVRIFETTTSQAQATATRS